MKPTRILLAVSGHGFGHAAQACAVASALRDLEPGIRFVIHSAVPHSFFQSRITGEFELIEGIVDPGIRMIDSLQVDREATRNAYLEFHADWEKHMESQARLLGELSPDAVFSDIAYATIEAAKELGIPTVALCSINWADILLSYFPEDSRIHVIIDVIRQCYQKADAFFQPEPSMPMSWLKNKQPIGPVVQPGHNRRPEVLRRLQVAEPTRLVMLAFGGIELDLALEHLPSVRDVYWLVQGNDTPNRDDITSWARLPMAFQDVLASTDAVVTKPGYGIFTEAAYHGIPVISIDRPDWPETPHLMAWLEQHVASTSISKNELESGAFLPVLQRLWGSRAPSCDAANGAMQAARTILRLAHPSS